MNGRVNSDAEPRSMNAGRKASADVPIRHAKALLTLMDDDISQHTEKISYEHQGWQHDLIML